LYKDIGAVPAIASVFSAVPLTALPEPVKSDILDPPAMDTWVNVRSLGAKGDGTTDDTEAIRNAIAQHRTILLAVGQYRVTDTISLKPIRSRYSFRDRSFEQWLWTTNAFEKRG